MNKLVVSLAASLAVLGVVFAQVPGVTGGPQEAPRPGQGPFPLAQGGGMRAGGGAAVAASGDYVYVVSGNTLFQYNVNGLKLVTRTTLPTQTRGEGGGRGEEGANAGGGRGNRNNPPSK
jgi:hypothetical protein